MAGIEPSYTKFNLTYPAPPFNSTGTVFLNDTGPSSSSLDVSPPHIPCNTPTT